MIQTYTPDHEAILCASRHDYEAFYRGEIRLREQIQYPPFADLFLLVFSDEDEEQAEQDARHCADWLKKRGEGLAVMGPGKLRSPKAKVHTGITSSSNRTEEGAGQHRSCCWR